MRLLNAELAHRAAPRTFSIPRRAVRENLAMGDLVKLLFEIAPPVDGVEVERMWVEVTHVDHPGPTYRGELVSTPRVLTDLLPRHVVEFGPAHVAARDAQPGDPLHVDPAAFAVVSRLVWDEDAWPNRLERREIPDPSFSGWVILDGSEASSYNADPSNFVPVRQGALFDRFGVLDSGLEGPVGTVMEWDGEAVEYRVVDPG